MLRVYDWDEAVYTCSLPLSPIIVFYDLDYLGDVKEIQIQIQVNVVVSVVIVIIKCSQNWVRDK